MFKSIFFPLVAVAAFITIVGLLGQGKLGFLLSTPKPTPNLSKIKINDIEIEVLIAKSSGERAKGLSERSSLPEDQGMIFVFTKDSKPIFWMKDTLIPLDIIWINDGKIVKIDKMVKPEPGVKDSDLKKYSSQSAVDFVLEVNGGFSDKNGLKIDQTLSGLEQL